MSEAPLPALRESTALIPEPSFEIPEPSEVAHLEVIEALERGVMERAEGLPLDVLIPASERIQALAKALAGTKPGAPAMGAARRIEYRIGKLLGEARMGRPEKSSVATELSQDDTYEFRQLAKLDLDWGDVKAWRISRSRMLKIAKERGRESSESAPEIRRGRFQDVLSDVEPASVALILTDPPYAQGALPEYADLASFAAEKLVDGGSLVCYVGQSTMPEALSSLASELRYWWCLALDHRGGGQQLPGKWVRIKWKPVLWFVKGQRRDRTFVHDVIRGIPPSKALHEWAQGVDEVLPLIESLTSPDDLVCDPFAGSGSFGVAAHKLGRRFIGADDR